MSEHSMAGEGAAQPLGQGRTAGQILREAREAAGIHVESLATSLKVPVHKLQALEADRYDLLPDTVFVRALASSICRSLRLPSAEVLALLPQTKSPQLTSQAAAGLNTPVKSQAAVAAGTSPQRGPLALIGVLLLAAAVVWWWPADLFKGSDRSAGRPAAPEPAAGVDSPPAVADAPAVAREAAPVAPEATKATPDAAAAVTAAAPLAAPPAPAGAASAAPAATVATPPSPGDVKATATVSEPGGTELLVFRARASSWIQVRNASGATVFQKTLAADETAAVSSVPPVSVIVGRADATEVLVRGKAFSLEGLARENVARFEVK